MAAPANTRGGLGWVILVIALAVPGVLFYNWWSRLKAEREKSVAAKARGRVPEGGVFQSSPNAKLVNPMTPAGDGVAASTEAVAAAPADAVEATPAPAAAAPVAAPEPDPAPAPAPAAAEAPAASTMTVTVVPLKRDPMLSPFDQVRMIEAEQAKLRAARDLEDMKRSRTPGKRAKPKPKDPKTLVELQGIISNAQGGFKAIVNNEVVGIGDFIGDTRVRIVKISDLGVTFEYQGRRFVKNVSRD